MEKPFNGSFQQLFRNAELYENPSLANDDSHHRIVMVQPDTSFLDEITSDHRRLGKRKVKTLESDEEKLRKMTLNIVDPDMRRHTSQSISNNKSSVGPQSNIRKSYNLNEIQNSQSRNRLIDNTNIPLSALVPRVNWEQEVRFVMENHDQATLNRLLAKNCLLDPHKTLLFPPQRLTTDIAPFHCFEPDSVEIHQELFGFDPLAQLIPNPSHLNGGIGSGNGGVTLDAYIKQAHSSKFEAQIKDIEGFNFKSVESCDVDDEEEEGYNALTTGVTSTITGVEKIKAEPITSTAVAASATATGTSTTAPAAPVMTKEEKDQQMMEDKIKRLNSVGIGREAATAILLRKQLGKRAIAQYGGDIPTTRTRRSAVATSVSHSSAANANRNVKMDLTEYEFYRFHRPRLPKTMTTQSQAAQQQSSSGTSGIVTVATNSKVWHIYADNEYYQMKALSSAISKQLSHHLHKKSLAQLTHHTSSSSSGNNYSTAHVSASANAASASKLQQEILNNLSLEQRQQLCPKPRLYTESEKQNLALNQGEFVCIEYVEENLPVYLHQGMASAILNYFRLPVDKNQGGDEEGVANSSSGGNNNNGGGSSSGNEDTTTETAMNNTATQKDRSLALEQSILASHNRIPRFLNLLLTSQEQKNINDSSYMNNNLDLPKLFYGETKVLKKDDESPFLGDIDENEVQPSIANTLFKAPLFQHKPANTDFILVRIKPPHIVVKTEESAVTTSSSKSKSKADKAATAVTTVATTGTEVAVKTEGVVDSDKDAIKDTTKDKDNKDKDKTATTSNSKSICFTLREMNTLFVCGQIEPLKIVPRPNNRMITKIQEKMILLAAARYFRSIGGAGQGNLDGVNFSDVMDNILKYSKKKATFNAANLKKILKDKVAEEITLNNGSKRWCLKETFYLPSSSSNNNNSSGISGGGGRGKSGGKSKVKFMDDDDDEVHYHRDNNNKNQNNNNHSNNKIMDLETQRQYSLEELERNLLPEDVCLQHTCNAYEIKLAEWGIFNDVELSRIKLWLERMQRLKEFKIDRAGHLKLNMNKIQNAHITQLIANPRHLIDNHKEYNAYQMLLKISIEDIRNLEEKIEIGQFIYERLVVAPWNTTETYVKSHIEKDGQGVMEINCQGNFLGDPSGKGEGYAYLRTLRYDSAASGTGAGTGTKKTVEKLVHTDKDLRKLNKQDLKRLLFGFGVSEKEMEGLKRWDMVDLVRMHSTKAERSGISSALHKYARGGVVSVRDRLVSGKKESFQDVADRIWRKQKAALTAAVNTSANRNSASSSSHKSSSGNNSSSSSSSSSALVVTTNKSRSNSHGSENNMDHNNNSSSDNNTDDSNTDSDDDEEEGWSLEEQLGLDEDIEKTVTRRAEALAIEYQEKKIAEDQLRQQNEAQELRAMRADLMKQQHSHNHSHSHQQQHVGVSGGSAVTSSHSHKPVSAIVAGVIAGTNTTALVSSGDHNINNSSAVITSSSSRPPSSSSSLHQQQQQLQQLQYYNSLPRPRKVVKRTIRHIEEDGSESVQVQYLLTSDDVDRVRREAERKSQEEELTSRSGLMLRNARLAAVIDTDEVTLSKALPSSLKIKLKLGAKSSSSASGGRGGSSKDQHNSSIDVMAGDDHDELQMHYKPRTGATARLGAAIHSNYRMPHVHFASKLETEIMKLWRKKAAFAFLYSVPRDFPGYHDIIKRPICLSDILQKIVSYQYFTVKGVLEDVVLMMNNAELFNGPKHNVAMDAKSIYRDIKVALTHDLTTLGADKDEFTLLEHAIAKKFSYWHRDTGGRAVSSTGSGSSTGISMNMSIHAPKSTSAITVNSTTTGVTKNKNSNISGVSVGGSSSGGASKKKKITHAPVSSSIFTSQQQQQQQLPPAVYEYTNETQPNEHNNLNETAADTVDEDMLAFDDLMGFGFDMTEGDL